MKATCEHCGHVGELEVGLCAGCRLEMGHRAYSIFKLHAKAMKRKGNPDGESWMSFVLDLRVLMDEFDTPLRRDKRDKDLLDYACRQWRHFVVAFLAANGDDGSAVLKQLATTDSEIQAIKNGKFPPSRKI